MKKIIFFIVCLFISILELNSITNDTYKMNVYGNSYATYDYIPFKSTSSNLQGTQYNTVRPLNVDGTVSMDYTTYKGVYSQRRSMYGNLDGAEDDGGDPIGGKVPIGEPIVPLLTLILAYLCYQEIKIRRERKHFFIQKNEA